jgi:hypothetical protein
MICIFNEIISRLPVYSLAISIANSFASDQNLQNIQLADENKFKM